MTPCHQGLNRYAQKRRHIRKTKQRYAQGQGNYTNVKLLEDKERAEAADESNLLWAKNYSHRVRNGGFTYWDKFYISGRRGYAKKCSDKKIRAHFREMLAHKDPDEIPIYRGKDHEKEFDYNWEVW